MEWIIYSFLMFSFSIFQYLVLRKLQKSGVHGAINTLMMFLPAVPFLIILVLALGKSAILPIPIILFLLVTTYFFAYFGNIFSIRGIERAPNSGYSLIIQKSYGIYTAIAALFLFQSTLTLKSIIAIIIVIGFSVLIMIDKKKQSETKISNKEWIIPSLMAFFLFGNLALASKYLLSIGIDPVVRTAYTFTILSIMYGLSLRGKISAEPESYKKLSPKLIVLLILMGVSNGLFNLFMQFAFDKAPNIGYVNIINAASIMPITLLSALLFKEKLNLQKLIGMLGVIVGIILLVI